MTGAETGSIAPLAGKVALVTGAGSGVGRATSLLLASQGMLVGLAGRRPAPLKETEQLIRSAGGRALALPVDVGDEEEVGAAVSQLIDAAGGVDVLIHCAGVGLYGPVETYRFADWQRTLATNVTGLFLCARALVPYLRQRGGGDIVAISSGAGLRGYADRAAYSASKFALTGFMQALAEEVGSAGIRCTTLSPGSVLTEFGPRSLEEKRASGDKYLEPEDVARAVLTALQQPRHAWLQDLQLWPF